MRAGADGTLAANLGLKVARIELLEVRARQLGYGPHRIERASFDGRATVKPEGVTLDGALDIDGLSLAAGARRIDGIRVSAPLAVRYTSAGTRLTLADPAEVTLPDLPDTRPVV